MYYVYEFYNVETGEILYAGKGTRNRYRVRQGRNHLLTEAFSKYNCDSRIVKTFEDEQSAFEYEYYYIKMLKERGECTCNIHSGGAGGSGEYWTEELRKEYSQNNVMKRPEQRERMSINNPMKNAEIAKRVNSQKRKAVIVGDVEYSSIAEAHKKLGATKEAIKTWCEKGINPQGQKCRFKDSEQVDFKGKRYNKGGSRGVVFRGVEYEAVKDFADAIGIGETTAHVWLRRGFNPQGEPCRFVNDERVLEFENRIANRNPKPSIPVIVNGITYHSCAEASKELDVPKSTLYSYLQGKRVNPKYICEYGNQQPSQENVDNCILEGSETNG